MKAICDSAYDKEVAAAKPVYLELRKVFVDSICTVANLVSILSKQFGIHRVGKVRRTDWLPVRETTKAMEQDQLDRSEEYMSEYDSEEEEAMVIPRDYDGDGQNSVSGDSSDYSYEDAEAMAEDHAATKA